MFARVTVRASELAESQRFYETVLRTLDAEAAWRQFGLLQAGKEEPATRRLHIGFFAASRSQVDAFWRAGTEAGYRDDGAPGLRPQYRDDYYGAFLLDPDGNSAEAVHHGIPGRQGIDHLWIRVADVARSKRFYETVAPHIGFRLRHDSRDRAGFASGGASFSLVAGTPTEHAHMAFRAAGGAAVEPAQTDPDGNIVEIVARSARSYDR